MFSLKITSSDEFLDMPLSAQALYLHLGMNADDDGFVQPKKIIRLVGAKEDDLKLLIVKKFVYPFQTGVVVIRHWKENNYIQKDRYTETLFKEEKALLSLDDNGFYTLDTGRIHSVYTLDTQDRLGKDRLGKVREEKNTLTSINSEEVFQKIADANNVPLSFVQSKYQDLVDYCESKGKKYKDYLATLRGWVKRDAESLRERQYNAVRKNRIAVYPGRQ